MSLFLPLSFSREPISSQPCSHPSLFVDELACAGTRRHVALVCVTLSVRGEVGQDEARERECFRGGEAPVAPVAVVVVVVVVVVGGLDGHRNGEETIASPSTAVTSGR